MVIFMVITSVFKGTSKAPLEVRHAKIALRHWRKCLKHKKLAPSRRKHLRCMPRYAFDASDNEAYTFTWISLPPLSSHLHLCSLTISSLEAWISLSLLRFLLWRLGYFFFSFGDVDISLPPLFPSLSLEWIWEDFSSHIRLYRFLLTP